MGVFRSACTSAFFCAYLRPMMDPLHWLGRRNILPDMMWSKAGVRFHSAVRLHGAMKKRLEKRIRELRRRVREREESGISIFDPGETWSLGPGE